MIHIHRIVLNCENNITADIIRKIIEVSSMPQCQTLRLLKTYLGFSEDACGHAKNKIAGYPVFSTRFWDKNTGICAGAIPYQAEQGTIPQSYSQRGSPRAVPSLLASALTSSCRVGETNDPGMCSINRITTPTGAHAPIALATPRNIHAPAPGVNMNMSVYAEIVLANQRIRETAVTPFK